MAELSRLGQPDQSGWTTLDRIGAAARKAREYISPWNVVSPTDVAGFAPGGGLVQAWQDSGRGLANLKAGNYGQAAADYGSMALNTAGELLPVAKLGMAMLPAAKKGAGITAYHGSPHDFDRFDMSKIGTGEGAQAYGHGLYFAESEDVARGYRNALSPGMGDAALRATGLNDADLRSLRQFTQTAVDPDVAIRDWLGWTGKKETPELRAAFMKEWNARKPGSLYQVRINANPDDFLDWDAPLSESARELLRASSVNAALEKRGYAGGIDGFGSRPGSQLHDQLSIALGDPASPTNRGKAAEALREAGIPGIKYLDAGSRGAVDVNALRGSLSMWEAALRKTPNDDYVKSQIASIRQQLADAEKPLTRNYVVFDDKMVEILKKYGWVPGMAIPAAAMMEYQQQGGSAPQM